MMDDYTEEDYEAIADIKYEDAVDEMLYREFSYDSK